MIKSQIFYTYLIILISPICSILFLADNHRNEFGFGIPILDHVVLYGIPADFPVYPGCQLGLQFFSCSQVLNHPFFPTIIFILPALWNTFGDNSFEVSSVLAFLACAAATNTLLPGSLAHKNNEL